MDFVETIARAVLAQFFEIAAFANLALGMQAKRAAVEK
jgi:hypothetical protein